MLFRSPREDVLFDLVRGAEQVEEDVLTGPAFRTPTAQQPPRALRLGLRLDF